jgi:hypothetical protein
MKFVLGKRDQVKLSNRPPGAPTVTSKKTEIAGLKEALRPRRGWAAKGIR